MITALEVAVKGDREWVVVVVDVKVPLMLPQRADPVAPAVTVAVREVLKFRDHDAEDNDAVFVSPSTDSELLNIDERDADDESDDVPEDVWLWDRVRVSVRVINR